MVTDLKLGEIGQIARAVKDIVKAEESEGGLRIFASDFDKEFDTTLDATYGLASGLQLTGGVEHDRRWRNTSGVRSVSHREDTEETSIRAGLRRSLSDTLNGAITFVHSERTGSLSSFRQRKFGDLVVIVGPQRWWQIDVLERIQVLDRPLDEIAPSLLGLMGQQVPAS